MSDLHADLEAESRTPGPTMTITKAQYGALVEERDRYRAALDRIYRCYEHDRMDPGPDRPEKDSRDNWPFIGGLNWASYAYRALHTEKETPVPATTEQQPVVDDATFMKNAREALVNGYDRLCAHCGTGVFDGLEVHERACPEYTNG